MAFEARLHHGTPLMVDYTPGTAVPAGKVIITADTVRIAHLDIPANTLGALAARGGVYECVADGAIGADRKVYWEDTAKKLTLTAGANKVFGVTVGAAAANNDLIYARHDPGA